MEKWFVPEHMKQLASKSTKVFGYDNQNLVNYTFNHLGFRTDNTAVESNCINLIGNSISFGIGLAWQNTFGAMVSNNIKWPLNNFSVGCYRHENHDNLNNIKILSDLDNDDIFVVQINNLDRLRVNPTLVCTGLDKNFCRIRFLNYFEQLSELLKNKTTIYVYWDDQDYDLPKSIIDQMLIVNKLHLDTSLPEHSNTFGIKSNCAIATAITNKLKLT